MRWVKWQQTWGNLPISRKLSFVIGGILGFLIFATIVSTILFFSMAQRNEQVLTKQETWFSQQETKHYIYARINSVLEYISTGNDQFLQKFYEDCEAARTYETYLLRHTPPEQVADIERFIQLSQDWEFILRNQVIPVYQLGNVGDAWLTLVREAEPMENQLIEEVTRFSSVKEDEILELSRSSSELGERLMYFSFLIAFLAALMSIILFFVLKNSINKPIQVLHQGTQRLAKGDFYYRVSIAGQDEFGQLGAAFNLMGERVNSLVEELHEINQQLKIESRNAKAANRLKTDFLATVSHELRTPLNGILGFTEAVSEQMVGPLTKKQQEYMGHIHDNAKHLLDIINEILDLSKIEAGKMELQYQEIEVNSFFSKSISVIQEIGKSKNIEISFENKCTVDTIWADPKRLTEIMNNLLSNAVKFTPAEGSIHVVLEQSEDLLFVSVTDTGIGISKEGLKKIFLSFYQDTSAWNRQHEGTGLGLALTRKLVELHEGTITVESELNKGTSFTFTLPLKQKDKVKGNSLLYEGSNETIKKVENLSNVWLVAADRVEIDSVVQDCEMNNCSMMIVTTAEFDQMWEEVEHSPALILYFWEDDQEVEGHSNIMNLYLAAKKVQEMGIPVLLITNRAFTLREKGLLYQFVKEIIDPEKVDLCERMSYWVLRSGGKNNETK